MNNDHSPKKAIAILTQLASGTHDPTPTRRLINPSVDPLAASIDAWWQEYFLSMYKQHREMAREALFHLVQPENPHKHLK